MIPEDLPDHTDLRRREAVRQLKRLFWDHDLCAEDFDHYGQWILERVLDYGSLRDVKLLVDLMGREAFLQGVQAATFQSAKTAEFWRSMLEKEGIPCTIRCSPPTAPSC
jgi:hypothetical protein